ncbi:hypothetical protein CN205_24130 [Sinorhizobium meliloti]|uniref:hypothetical protein n=1 Tax=Rhizobium meliloti TaxID=382 RepID=UPI000FD77577|nr:hypothetical protein [Sinorhizobium meliloti]RVI03194.1 hypothetical protein CN205_24130 [Sinorhizobium meliloti]
MNKVMMSPAAFVSRSVGAFSVRGYQMGAIRDGWWAFISTRRGKPNDDLIDELCIARTKSGRTLLRFLRKGRKQGTWDLVPVTGEPLLDQELEWAERVIWLEPHRLTHSEIDALQELDIVE